LYGWEESFSRASGAEVDVKFGNFLFPDSRDPEHDGDVIDETLREAWLSDELGVDAIWLAEHHFDGICAYADPVAFAGALAATTRRAKLGFAVLQMALHHPIRLAVQLAVLDNITKGRLIVGLGRGSSYNIYDYQGFGIDHHEAQARLDEAEEILVRAWTEGGFRHHGRFWDIEVPMLRPWPFTKPHPPLVRAASGEASMLALARQVRPFLMNVQSSATTRRRFGLYLEAMAEAGFDHERIARNLDDCWVWRNVFVAETDAEAEPSAFPPSRRWRRRAPSCATASIARPDCGSRCRPATCLRPAPMSSTALSAVPRRALPRPSQRSTSSASAA
jgi:alkanesulfonate monooxygenase SsuD/methylene tetrahydromethanopterin reductase-like flavin-dependent oxidoreductase (luciferase family)